MSILSSNKASDVDRADTPSSMYSFFGDDKVTIRTVPPLNSLSSQQISYSRPSGSSSGGSNTNTNTFTQMEPYPRGTSGEFKLPSDERYQMILWERETRWADVRRFSEAIRRSATESSHLEMSKEKYYELYNMAIALLRAIDSLDPDKQQRKNESFALNPLPSGSISGPGAPGGGSIGNLLHGIGGSISAPSAINDLDIFARKGSYDLYSYTRNSFSIPLDTLPLPTPPSSISNVGSAPTTNNQSNPSGQSQSSSQHTNQQQTLGQNTLSNPNLAGGLSSSSLATTHSASNLANMPSNSTISPMAPTLAHTLASQTGANSPVMQAGHQMYYPAMSNFNFPFYQQQQQQAAMQAAAAARAAQESQTRKNNFSGEVFFDDVQESKKPKKARRRRTVYSQKRNLRCHMCNATETPEWRRGPDGDHTLCNACGLHYAKTLRKERKAREGRKHSIDLLLNSEQSNEQTNKNANPNGSNNSNPTTTTTNHAANSSNNIPEKSESDEESGSEQGNRQSQAKQIMSSEEMKSEEGNTQIKSEKENL